MDATALARLQFALTTVYHFFFVPLTLGLSLLVALMETLYVRSGNEIYLRMTRFWGKLFLINFAMGVVTGIVQEFQFGMNWSSYSRYVGDIFGAPLAIEALLAFFLESTFLGVWVFGWEKLSKGAHAVTIWLVAIGSNLSALWILIANSFMQQPVGYVIRNNRAELADFSKVIFNPNLLTQFPHVISSGLVTAAFFVIAISAYHLFRKNETELFKRSFKIAAVVGLIFACAVALIGHQQAQHIVRVQPMKMAAMEALWDRMDPASLSLFTIGDMKNRKDILAIRIPNLLSLLAYNRLDGEVRGMNDLQEEYAEKYGSGDYVPPSIIPYWSFRIMVGSGMLLIALGLYAFYLVLRNQFEKHQRWLRYLPFAIVLPYLANTTGWLLTEVGRYPWVVYGLVRLEAGVSPTVSVGMLWVSLVGYVLVYGLLVVATIYLMNKYAKAGPAPAGEKEPEEALPSLLGNLDNRQ